MGLYSERVHVKQQRKFIGNFDCFSVLLRMQTTISTSKEVGRQVLYNNNSKNGSRAIRIIGIMIKDHITCGSHNKFK